MKKRVTFLILLGLLAAGLFQLQHGSWLSARLRAPTESALTRALGRPVLVGGVGGGLRGWLWLRDVAIPAVPGDAEGLSATVAALGLKLNLWQVLRGHVDLGGLEAVQVTAPTIYVAPPLRFGSVVTPPLGLAPRRIPAPPAAGVSGFRRFYSMGPSAFSDFLKTIPIPPVPLEVERGAVWSGLSNTAHCWVKDLYLDLEPRAGGGWRLRGKGEPWDRGEASFSAVCGPGFSAPSIEAEVRGLTWPSWTSPQGWSTPQGRMDCTLSAHPGPGTWPDGWGLKADGTLQDAAFGLADKPGCSRVRALWSLRGPRLNVSGRGLYGGGLLLGRAWALLPDGAFGVTLTAQGSDLGVLAATVGAPENLGLSGPADLNLMAFGSLAAPELQARLRSSSALWKGHPLTGLDLTAAGGRGRWTAQGVLAWDGGSGSLNLDLDRDGLRQISFKAGALPADWLDAFAGADLRGRLDGNAHFARQGEAWSAALKGTQLSWGSQELDQVAVNGEGDAQSARVRARADLPGRPNFSATLGFRLVPGGNWTLEDARLFEKARLLARVEGGGRSGGRGVEAQADLTVKTSALDLALVAPSWVAKGWSGRLRGRGTLHYSGGDWRGGLHAYTRSLARRGWSYPGSVALDFGPGGLSVTVESLRDGELQGVFSAPTRRGPWSAALKLSQAHLAAYTALGFGLPLALSGSASGTLAWSSAPVGRLEARLSFSNLLPTILPGLHGHVDLLKDGTRWDLRSLNLAAGQGNAKGQAQIDLGGLRPWTGFLRWSGLGHLGQGASGEAHFSGGGAFPGRILVSPWSLSGSALPALDASLDFGSDGLRQALGNLGPNLGWSLLLEGKALWRLRATLQGFDVGPFAGFLPGRHSRASAIRLNGLAQGALDGSGLLSASLDLREVDGARLKGRYDRLSGTASLRAAFHSLDLARLAREVGPLGWSLPPVGGSADGSLSATGAALTLSASVAHFSWAKQDLGPLAISLAWNKNSLRIPTATLGADSGPSLSLSQVRWQGSARSWTASGGLSLTAWPVGIWSVGGSALARASGGGTKLDWNARFNPLFLGLRRWPVCALEGSWDGRHYSMREAAHHPRFVASGSYFGGVFKLDHLRTRSGAGVGTLTGIMGADSSLDFTAQSKGFPASDLAQFMSWPQDWSGSSWGTVRVTGSVDKPHTVVSAKVEDGSVEGLPFDLGTGTVVQDAEWVDLSPGLPIRLTRRDGTVLDVGGRLPLDYHPSSGGGMDVWAVLRGGGLGLFSGLPAIFHAQGPLSLKLRFRGDPDNPRVDGSFVVMDGSLDPAWLLPKLEGVRILARIDDSKVSFPEAEARASGDGRMLWVRATDPSKPAFVFRDWLPSDMNLSLSSGRAGLPLRNTRALDFISGVAHPDLTVSGSWDAPLLGGSVLLERGNADKALIQWPPQFQASTADSGGWFSRLGYHLVLKARSDVMVRTDAAEVFVDTGEKGVLVEGSGDDKRLYGHLRLVQGSVDYLLATFQLAPDHDSWLEMRGDAAPQLELWGLDDLGNVSLAGAAGASEDVQILLHAWGPIGQVQMRLLDQDDPSLTQNQLAGLIGVGGDSGDPRSQGGFTRMLGSVPAALISKWARKTGLLDEVNFSVPALDQAMAPTPVAGDATGQVQPLSQATPTSGTARSLLEVSAGRYLGSKLFLGVDTQVIQRSVVGGSQINPELGGVIEYSLPNHARLSAERNIDSSGITDSRVMLEDTSHFDNYNPNQRRWDGSPTATPGPLPIPSPSPTPGDP